MRARGSAPPSPVRPHRNWWLTGSIRALQGIIRVPRADVLELGEPSPTRGGRAFANADSQQTSVAAVARPVWQLGERSLTAPIAVEGAVIHP